MTLKHISEHAAINFDFISNRDFREILLRDYDELLKVLDGKAVKSITVLSGSILEAVLVNYFIQYPITGISNADILQKSLGQLIDLAHINQLISDAEKKLSEVLKDYRNLIHPGREIRSNQEISENSANIAFNVMCMILKTIQVSYISKYGRTADEVFNKLKNDLTYSTIFEHTIIKLNQTEKSKLLKHLVEWEFGLKSQWEAINIVGSRKNIKIKDLTNLRDVKPFINTIKGLVPQSEINLYLKKLLEEIETGQEVNAFCLYNLFHENLDILNNDEKDLISIYILNLGHRLIEEMREIANERTYSTIGKYIVSENSKNALRSFLSMSAVESYSADVVEQVINSLSEPLKNEMVQYLTNFLTPKTGNLPDHMINFYKEALEKGLIVTQR